MNSIEMSTEPKAASTHTIQACPRCRSIEIEPIMPVANASLRDAAEAAWCDHWAGRTGPALRYLLRWTCVETANALRDRYRCAHCGWGFREVQS